MSDWYTKKTFATLLREAAERWAEREVLYYEGQRWSFAALEAAVDAAAKGFIAQGIESAESVALWMPNRVEWIISFFALSKIGAVLVPINTRFRSVDLEYVVRQSNCRVLITVDRSGPVDFLAMVNDVIPEIATDNSKGLCAAGFPALRQVIVLGDSAHPGTCSWQQVLREGEAVTSAQLDERHAGVSADDTTLMLYTSGTTGFPKGVMHSHIIQRSVVDIANRLGYGCDDVVLVNWPLFHVVGLYIGPLLSVIAGTRMVLTTTFDAAQSLGLVQSERVTRIWGFDTQLTLLMNHPDRANTDLGSLRTGLGAVGMVSSEPAAQRAQQLLCPTVSGWGMTEVGAGVIIGHPEGAEADRWLTSGYPLPGLECKVIDPHTKAVVAHGELGELCVRGYSVTRGYYNKPEETAAAIDAQGWLHTGDVASMRADGAIRFLGRYSDLLKVGGENVDPAEVEGFLLAHPAIEQVQVVGAPDPLLSEVVCACVVLKPGESLNNDDLDAFCRGKLASFKIPRYTLLMEAFPMTPSGKAQKFILRERAAEALALG